MFALNEGVRGERRQHHRHHRREKRESFYLEKQREKQESIPLQLSARGDIKVKKRANE